MADGPVEQPHPRLGNLLAALALGLVDDGVAAMEEATSLSATGVAALISLSEFLDGANIGRLSAVLGLSHSGAVRLVGQLEARGLVRRTHGQDRRQVNVELTPEGRGLAELAASARMDAVQRAVTGLPQEDAQTLERLVARLVEDRVTERLRRRREDGWAGAWWCRMCDFEACERPDGNCPAARF
jgi:DNA-binding MarR family transcriptional regulator